MGCSSEVRSQISPNLSSLYTWSAMVLLLCLNLPLATLGEVILVLNRHTLGHVVDLVDTDQPLRKFKHVIS